MLASRMSRSSRRISLDLPHAVQRCLERLGGRAHSLYRGVTSRIGGVPCVLRIGSGRLTRFAQVLPFLPHGFERLTMLVADLPRFFCQLPEPFRLILADSACSAGM